MHSAVGIPLLPAQAVAQGQGGGGCQSLPPMSAAAPTTLAQLRAGQLRGVRRLDLSCGLSHFPPEIFDLADSLEVLNLSGNALDSLPPDLGRLHQLRVLFASYNRFTTLPQGLRGCAQLETVGFRANQITHLDAAALPPSLRALILTDNQLSHVPAALGQFSQLEKLMLSGNRLTGLPPELQACQRLALLRVAVNQLNAWPSWLAGLPQLAWLAGAGNPCTLLAEQQALAHPAAIDWSELTLEQVLGEGTSGVIHRARLASGEPVAVKLFKSAMTTDGAPSSEMAACLAAGTHPHLIGTLGRVVGHPDGTAGLLMPLIDASFQTLAAPPSLQSCTRDVYPDAARFTLAQVRSIAHCVALAMTHLHARGLIHGDLYAHNILWHPSGPAWLGDLGAAAFLPANAAQAEMLIKVEVCAYGKLLQELLQRCDAPAPALSTLSALQRRCEAPDLADRPAGDELVRAVDT